MNIILRLAVLLVAAVHVPIAGAAVFRVGSGATCSHSSLAAALADSVANGPGLDEIRLTVAVQTASAAFNLVGSDVTIIGGYGSCSDPAPSPGARSVIVGNAHDSVFYVSGNRQVVLQQLDITNGGRPGFANGDFAVGGGLWLNGGTATLHGVRIAHNRARVGGGLAATGNSVLVIFPGAPGSIIEENEALLGGGIYVGERATLRIENDRVSVVRNAANESTSAWENRGGGIYARGGATAAANIEVASLTAEPGVPTPPISGFLLAQNTATGDGGGMALVGNAHFNAIEATLRDNVAGGIGGAIAALGETIGPGASVTLMRRNSAHPAWLPACAGLYGCNRLEGNVATRGGAIFVMHGQLNLAQMLMAGNRSTAGGGAAISTGNINGAPNPVNRIRLHSMVIARNQCAGPTPSSPCSTLSFWTGPNELKVQHVTLADNLLQAGPNGGASEIRVFGANNPLVIRSSIIEPLTASEPVSYGASVDGDCVMAPLFPVIGTRSLARPVPYGFRSRGTDDYRPAGRDPAIDGCDSSALIGDELLDANLQHHGGIDHPQVGNRLGPLSHADIGAFEVAYEPDADQIFFDNFEH